MYDAALLDELLRLAPRLNRKDALSLREAGARDTLHEKQASAGDLAAPMSIASLAANGFKYRRTE